ncbi:MAG: heavy-metal-associated domain-containing protein [Magnetospirillum sp.]|nr:heavy-metal-associated domain-containing protein [Magnetospirillum sp.]
MSTTYKVSGMTCGGCARSVEQAIKAEAPAASVTIDLGTATVTVDGAEEAQVKKAVDGAGFDFQGAV